VIHHRYAEVSIPDDVASFLPRARRRQKGRCAINFFGLPRAFKSLVLPSIVKNIIEPNRMYKCDFFVHYNSLAFESSGRSGKGGKIDPEEVRLLEDAVKRVNNDSTVQFSFTTEADFWLHYKPLLDKIDNTTDPEGEPLYFPWRTSTYIKPTTVNNIIKMWHSIQEVYFLMERYGATHHVDYETVAMLRSDVLYMTLIDLYEYPDKLVVPGFNRFPVNDRAVYGPAKAVRIWATERFSRMEEHVQRMYRDDRGYGLHSERFLKFTLFPAMSQEMNSTEAFVEHPTLCFLRTRADETVWATDCQGTGPKDSLPSIEDALILQFGSRKEAIESVLDRSCPGNMTHLFHWIYALSCKMSVAGTLD